MSFIEWVSNLYIVRFMKDVILDPPLKAAEIEINSFCNRKCNFCPNHGHTREIAYLDRSLFYKLINDLKKMKFRGKLTFSLFNEPLLDNRLLEFISHVRKELPSVFLYLTTNGDLLNIHMWRMLRGAGLDSVHITLYDPEANKNIKNLLVKLSPEEKNHLYIHSLDYICNRAGLVNTNGSASLPLKKYCTRPFYRLSVNYMGRAVLCCNDYFGRVEMGDLRVQPVSAIWRSKLYRHYRKRLFFKDRAHLKLCDRCDMVYP